MIDATQRSPSAPSCPRITPRRAGCAMALAATLGLAAIPAGAFEPNPSAPASIETQIALMSGSDLRRHYLNCERLLPEPRPAANDAFLCSLLYETLKREAFDGDWRRLREWARGQLDPAQRP